MFDTPRIRVKAHRRKAKTAGVRSHRRKAKTTRVKSHLRKKPTRGLW